MGDGGDCPPTAPRIPSTNISVSQFPTAEYVVTVDDPASWETWSVIGQISNHIIGHSPRLLVLDLTGLHSLDLTGLEALCGVAAQAGESDIAFCVVGARDGPIVMAIAEAGLTELFELVESASDALLGFL